MMKRIAHSFYIVFLPFSGSVFIKKPLKLAVLASFLFLLFIVMVPTRWIALPVGMTIILIHLFLAAIAAVYVGLSTQTITIKQYALSTLLSLCALLVLAGMFHYRQNLLGIDVFFVPSLSMTPTLEPGDIILVDTFAYEVKKPKAEEIVVFKRSSEIVYVKRIHQVLPNGILVRGDNNDHSVTEIALGRIPMSNVLGRVNGVLFNARKPLDSRRLLVTL